MQKSCSLIYEAVFGVKYLRISCKYYILNDMSVLVHLCLCFFLIVPFPDSLSDLLLLVLLFFEPILFHHVLLANLVVTVTHLG